jgi:hypothetical protein
LVAAPPRRNRRGYISRFAIIRVIRGQLRILHSCFSQIGGKRENPENASTG